MAEMKTKPTGENVTDFLNQISDDQKRRDSFALVKLMQQITKKKPKVWASSMIGFGDYHYEYASGRKGDVFAVGFAPRKRDLTLYVMHGCDGQGQLIKKLGKCKTSKACLYIKRLDDVHLPTLRKLIQLAYKQAKSCGE